MLNASYSRRSCVAQAFQPVQSSSSALTCLLACTLACAPIASLAQAPSPQSAPQQPKLAATTPAPAAKPEISPEAARHARAAFTAGQRAEREAQWRAAFTHFTEAAGLDPTSADYRVARELARFRVAQDHVDRAEAAAVNNRIDQAILELRAALSLDPSYGVAAERLRQLEAISSRGVRVADAANAPATPQLRLLPDTRAFNFRGNTRGAYEDIARQFNLTATFDDAVRIRNVRFRLPEVDAITALNALATQTTTFWIPIGERSFFVTDDTEQRRREYEPNVVRILTLPSSTTTERMTELLRILRDIVDIRRIQLDLRSRTLTLRASAESVALATALIEELEQPRGELMLEVTVAEVDRSNAVRLGLLPPSKAQVFTISPQDLQQLQSAQQSFGDLSALLQRIFGTSGGSGLGGLVPPLIAFGGGQTVGLATLPGASAEFAQAMSVFRSARRVYLRSEDSQPASFFIGERYPINLSLLSEISGAPLPSPGGAVIPRQDFAAGDGPSAVTAFDLDLDNDLDLIVANQAANTVSVLLGSGDGSFAAATNFPVGQAPVSVTIGDFNADGDLDLVTANQGDNSITVLFGAGDGTFGPPAAFAVGTLPRAVVAGNFNGDGNVDLIVANHGSNTISLLLGTPTGTFPTRTDFPVGGGPIALTTADFNRDNFLDVAVANQNSNTVSLLLGTGAGAFSTLFTLGVGAGPRGLVAGSLNADNFPDLAVANEASNTVSILTGNGDGTFLGLDFVTGNAPTSVVIGDFDSSGVPDVITANFAADSIALLLGLGDGTLGLRADLATGNGPIALVPGSFNGDGRLDLAIANQLSDDVTVILNSVSIGPGGNFQQQQPYPAFQFEELGFKVRATPRMHQPDEVTLQLSIEIRSRSGEAFNGIPVITNRTLEETVRLKEDETTVIAGILQRNESLSLSGTPGLAQLFIPGRVLSNRNRNAAETELLLFVTPRRLRLNARTTRSLYPPASSSSPAARPPGSNP